jgi:hypothetical protein
MDPYRTTPPAPEPPTRVVPWLVRAQLLFGGHVQLIGLVMIAGPAGAVPFMVPALGRTSAADPDYGGLFALSVIALIGLGIVIGSVPGALRQMRLLRTGRVTTGSVSDVRLRYEYRPPYGLARSRAKQWTVTYEFETEDGGTSRARAVAYEEPDLEDEGEIVYDPRWPDHAAPLDYLPGKPEIERGRVQLRDGRLRNASFALVAIVLVVVDAIVLLH